MPAVTPAGDDAADPPVVDPRSTTTGRFALAAAGAASFLWRRRQGLAVVLGLLTTPAVALWAWAEGEGERFVRDVADEALGDPSLAPGLCAGTGSERRCGPPPSSNAARFQGRLEGADRALADLVTAVAPMVGGWPAMEAKVGALTDYAGSDLCIRAGGAPGTRSAEVRTGDRLRIEVHGICRWYGWQKGAAIVIDEVLLTALEDLRSRVAHIASKKAIQVARRAARGR